MAKRRRLTLPDPGASAPPGFPEDGFPEAKAFLRPDLGASRDALSPGAAALPPIAQVAADASATAALRALSDSMAAVRAEGRLVARLPLDAVVPDHLVRDRIEADDEAMAALTASIRQHGQRTPIEVADLGDGRYGLISGWRRLTALGRLAAGEARFGTVLALVRRPGSAAEAYVAMVEENEVRSGLSHYERARIVARAAALGVFGSEKEALSRLFAHASRARRSKVGSFLRVYHALDGALRFPAALPERSGLQLARLAEADPSAVAALGAALTADPPATAEAEAARIGQALSQRGRAALVASLPGAARMTPLPEAPPGPLVLRSPVRPAPFAPAPARPAELGPAELRPAEALPARVPAAPAAPPPAEVRPGVFLAVSGGFTRPVLTLSGPGVDPVFRERLLSWLETGR